MISANLSTSFSFGYCHFNTLVPLWLIHLIMLLAWYIVWSLISWRWYSQSWPWYYSGKPFSCVWPTDGLCIWTHISDIYLEDTYLERLRYLCLYAHNCIWRQTQQQASRWPSSSSSSNFKICWPVLRNDLGLVNMREGLFPKWCQTCQIHIVIQIIYLQNSLDCF